MMDEMTNAGGSLIAECEARVETVTLPVLIQRNAVEFADRPALTAGERTVTWGALRAEVGAFARGLADLGLVSGERLMIMMASRLEHWVTDLASVHLGAVPCTAYQTLSTDQIGYVARHSAATFVVLEGADEVARWRPVLDDLPQLRRVLVVDAGAVPADDDRFVAYAKVLAAGRRLHDADPHVFESMWAAIAPDDPIAMMYTSGTTGDPKGVVLSHRNAFYEAAVVDVLVPTPMHATAVAYLPLAHIAERELSIYRAAVKALHVTVCPDPAGVVAALAQTRPPAFFGVPRVWEKLAAGLRARVGSLPEAQADAIMAAHALSVEAFRIAGTGGAVPVDLAERVAAADAMALAPIRAMLGLDALEWASSGSAPLPVEVLEYLAGFGIRVLEVWGMSETTGCATVSTPDGFRIGAVGRAVPGVDIKLADDGEIFVRGPVVFLGYLQDDGTVVSPCDADGWLATGDVGTIDDDGFLTITDRKKELIITSSGKNIAPTRIEGMLRAHPLVGQAIAVGDRRPYVTALVTLDDETAPAWAAANGIGALSMADLAVHERVVAELDGLVASVNDRLARAEQIKRYVVLPEVWTPDSGELTPTMKLRRRVVLDRYDERISALYPSS
jgi:long-chain acyl-CoA synthetase